MFGKANSILDLRDIEYQKNEIEKQQMQQQQRRNAYEEVQGKADPYILCAPFPKIITKSTTSKKFQKDFNEYLEGKLSVNELLVAKNVPKNVDFMKVNQVNQKIRQKLRGVTTMNTNNIKPLLHQQQSQEISNNRLLQNSLKIENQNNFRKNFQKNNKNDAKLYENLHQITAVYEKKILNKDLLSFDFKHKFYNDKACSNKSTLKGMTILKPYQHTLKYTQHESTLNENTEDSFNLQLYIYQQQQQAAAPPQTKYIKLKKKNQSNNTSTTEGFSKQSFLEEKQPFCLKTLASQVIGSTKDKAMQKVIERFPLRRRNFEDNKIKRYFFIRRNIIDEDEFQDDSDDLSLPSQTEARLDTLYQESKALQNRILKSSNENNLSKKVRNFIRLEEVIKKVEVVNKTKLQGI